MLKEKQKQLMYFRQKMNKNFLPTKNKSNSDTNRTTPTSILKQTSNNNVNEPKKNYYSLTQKYLLKHYNISPKEYDRILLENVIQSKYCHDIAIFKEKILFNYEEEFLKRFYNKKESKERIPKFVLYYKNYLIFFCKPTFTELNLNDIIQSHGEKKAQLFYNENYKEEKKDKDNKENPNNIKFTYKIRKNISTISMASLNFEESINSLLNHRKKLKEITSVNNSTLIKIMNDLSIEKQKKESKNKNKSSLVFNKKKQIAELSNLKLLYQKYNKVMKKKARNNLTSPLKISSLTDRLCYTESNKTKTINSSTSQNKKVLKINSRNRNTITIANTKHIVSLSKNIFKTQTHNHIQNKIKKNNVYDLGSFHSKNVLSTQFQSLSRNKKSYSNSKANTERKKLKISNPLFSENFNKFSRNQKNNEKLQKNFNFNQNLRKKTHVITKTTIGDFFKTTDSIKTEKNNKLKLNSNIFYLNSGNKNDYNTIETHHNNNKKSCKKKNS